DHRRAGAQLGGRHVEVERDVSAHVRVGHPIRRDYDRARAELALAQQSLPNNAQVYELAGSMDCRQRRWADATNNLERACEIDPLNFPYLINLGSTYLWLHDYDQHARIMDRIVALHPE